MVMQDIRYAAPTAVPVIDEEKFEEIVRLKVATGGWRSLSGITCLHRVEGISDDLFSKAQSAASRWVRGESRTQEDLATIARGWLDWYFCCQERDGKVVYLRGEKHAA